MNLIPRLLNSGSQEDSGNSKKKIGEPGSQPGGDISSCAQCQTKALKYKKTETYEDASGNSHQGISSSDRRPERNRNQDNDQAGPGFCKSGLELGVDLVGSRLIERVNEFADLKDFLQRDVGTFGCA